MRFLHLILAIENTQFSLCALGRFLTEHKRSIRFRPSLLWARLDADACGPSDSAKQPPRTGSRASLGMPCLIHLATATDRRNAQHLDRTNHLENGAVVRVALTFQTAHATSPRPPGRTLQPGHSEVLFGILLLARSAWPLKRPPRSRRPSSAPETSSNRQGFPPAAHTKPPSAPPTAGQPDTESLGSSLPPSRNEIAARMRRR